MTDTKPIPEDINCEADRLVSKVFSFVTVVGDNMHLDLIGSRPVIAAALMAEREANAKIAEDFPDDTLIHGMLGTIPQPWSRRLIANAIRKGTPHPLEPQPGS